VWKEEDTLNRLEEDCARGVITFWEERAFPAVHSVSSVHGKGVEDYHKIESDLIIKVN